jgi:hypothetical protein
MNSSTSLDILLHSQLKVNQHLGRTCCLHLKAKKSDQQKSNCPLLAGVCVCVCVCERVHRDKVTDPCTIKMGTDIMPSSIKLIVVQHLKCPNIHQKGHRTRSHTLCKNRLNYTIVRV